MLNTPVLFIVFKRPQTTQVVFEKIRKAKPKKLYVAADAPRHSAEEALCREVRRIATQVDWDCELKVFFQEKNLGCGQAPAAAITWLFEHETHGIILEDDCLPQDSFFVFCEQLLEKYAQDQRIFMISGTNYQKNWHSESQSYHFSFHASCWGWATWRRAWQHFDYQIRNFDQPLVNQMLVNSIGHLRYYQTYLQKAYQKTFEQPQSVSWWDYQWAYARYLQSGLCVVPAVNLVTNIGFEADATHTNASAPDPFVNLPAFELDFPIRSNEIVVADRLYEQKIFDCLCPPPLPLWRRAIRKLKSFLD